VVTTSSPGLQVEAALRDVQRLGGVAGERQLLRVAAELVRQLPAHVVEHLFDQGAVMDR
jgi:hypothetical protein